MKFHQFKEGVGRIVKGVNTTPDVGPNQTSIEAGKFGNKVDKDGRPPTLSKKVKGSKTNVLFNLGMAEGKEQQKPIKPRDPNAQTMQDLRKSGAMGAHKDKKKLAKQGYQKHKTKFDEDKEVAQPSEIFVDMDGVLADFFGSWKKLVGKDWRKIDDIDSALQKIRDTENFWLDIPPTKNANNLLGIIKKIKGSYNILSAPLPNDPNSEPHKREWIKNHLKGFPPNRVIITHDKAKYATQPDGTPNILIDDYGINVQKWESAGGVGFKHKDHKFERTARNLAAHLKQPAKENYTREELPQISKKDLKHIYHTVETIKVADIKPIQKERIKENFTRQLNRVHKGKYSPIIVDCENKIINGHHRYDIIKMLEMEEITVYKLPLYVENLAATDVAYNESTALNSLRKFVRSQREAPDQILYQMMMAPDTYGHSASNFVRSWYEKTKEENGLNDVDSALEIMVDELGINENFADGKVKGKSRPGRVKRSGASCNGSVTSLRKRAKNASGEKAKMYHWCANMKSGKGK